jgi:CheY-like chemotaxis protein
MGLALVHGVVANLGGEIRVESEPGRGARFEVLLPELWTDESAPNEVLAQVPRGQGQHVLVVDDELPVRTSVDRLLRALGYRVTGSADAAEALRAVRADPEAFDLVLTDYTMPGTNGLDLAAELLRVRPDLPILLATGFSRSVDGEMAVAQGIRGLVMKPFNAQVLGEALQRALA